MVGTLLNERYRIDAELGRGGMGAVYRAYDTLLDRAVAVKVLSDPRLGTEGRARLLREAQAVAKLDHVNIVAVYDAGESNGSPFVVMQLVEGSHCTNAGPRGSMKLSQWPNSCVPRFTMLIRWASFTVI